MTTKEHRALAEVMRLPGNTHCVDCCSKSPTWASINLGVFICIDCSGIHRMMGTHITKIKSVTLDGWRMDWVELMRHVGNLRANGAWEARMPAHAKLSPNATMAQREAFIRQKYERGSWKGKPTAESYARVGAQLHMTPAQIDAVLRGEAEPETPSTNEDSGTPTVNPAIARRRAAKAAAARKKRGGDAESGEVAGEDTGFAFVDSGEVEKDSGFGFLGGGGGDSEDATPESSGFEFVGSGVEEVGKEEVGGSGFEFLGGGGGDVEAGKEIPKGSDDEEDVFGSVKAVVEESNSSDGVDLFGGGGGGGGSDFEFLHTSATSSSNPVSVPKQASIPPRPSPLQNSIHIPTASSVTSNVSMSTPVEHGPPPTQATVDAAARSLARALSLVAHGVPEEAGPGDHVEGRLNALERRDWAEEAGALDTVEKVREAQNRVLAEHQDTLALMHREWALVQAALARAFAERQQRIDAVRHTRLTALQHRGHAIEREHRFDM